MVLPAFTDLVQLEQSPILVKKVVGKEDVNISAAAERTKLVAEVWRFVLQESKADIDKYLNDKSNLDKSVAGITKAIESRKEKLTAMTSEIATLERSITSVQPTVDEINGILTSFGFTSFKLATAGEGGTFYKLVRHDGSDALKTSERGREELHHVPLLLRI